MKTRLPLSVRGFQPNINLCFKQWWSQVQSALNTAQALCCTYFALGFWLVFFEGNDTKCAVPGMSIQGPYDMLVLAHVKAT